MHIDEGHGLGADVASAEGVAVVAPDSCYFAAARADLETADGLAEGAGAVSEAFVGVGGGHRGILIGSGAGCYRRFGRRAAHVDVVSGFADIPSKSRQPNKGIGLVCQSWSFEHIHHLASVQTLAVDLLFTQQDNTRVTGVWRFKRHSIQVRHGFVLSIANPLVSI